MLGYAREKYYRKKKNPKSGKEDFSGEDYVHV